MEKYALGPISDAIWFANLLKVLVKAVFSVDL